MSQTLMAASTQWATRPNHERFLDLPSMLDASLEFERYARSGIVPADTIGVESIGEGDDDRGIVFVGKAGKPVAPNHWAFGQACALAQAPAAYLRRKPASMAALNLGHDMILRAREVGDVGMYIHRAPGEEIGTLHAMTGPRYGRISNSSVIQVLTDRFGDGVTGNGEIQGWRIPGEFKQWQDRTITKQNTTLYSGPEDMFAFLADEEHPIAVPNRRNGETGYLSRGIIVSNSTVGKALLSLRFFYFDYMCCNHIIWGVEQLVDIGIRHTSGAADRFITELQPALIAYANSSETNVQRVIADAQKDTLKGRVAEFMAKQFGKAKAAAMTQVHLDEEGRPPESRWDVVTAATAYARGVTDPADRTLLDVQAGKLLVPDDTQMF